jgi:hypothetical protein
MAVPSPPGEANDYLKDHVALLRRSLREHTGRDLVDPAVADAEAARWVFHAPFVLLSHNADPDPMLTYGNRQALALFELSWQQLTAMPSRLTAEAPNREERARLLAEVAAKGFIDDYSGVRVSRTGRRFRIAQATVWNLSDSGGAYCGQAALFREWTFL